MFGDGHAIGFGQRDPEGLLGSAASVVLRGQPTGGSSRKGGIHTEPEKGLLNAKQRLGERGRKRAPVLVLELPGCQGTLEEGRGGALSAASGSETKAREAGTLLQGDRESPLNHTS